MTGGEYRGDEGGTCVERYLVGLVSVSSGFHGVASPTYFILYESIDDCTDLPHANFLLVPLRRTPASHAGIHPDVTDGERVHGVEHV